MPTNDYPLIPAEQLAECVRRPPPRANYYVVMAWSCAWGWSLRGGTYDTEEDARAGADKLATMWVITRILKIPGDQSE